MLTSKSFEYYESDYEFPEEPIPYEDCVPEVQEILEQFVKVDPGKKLLDKIIYLVYEYVLVWSPIPDCDSTYKEVLKDCEKLEKGKNLLEKVFEIIDEADSSCSINDFAYFGDRLIPQS